MIAIFPQPRSYYESHRADSFAAFRAARSHEATAMIPRDVATREIHASRSIATASLVDGPPTYEEYLKQMRSLSDMHEFGSRGLTIMRNGPVIPAKVCTHCTVTLHDSPESVLEHDNDWFYYTVAYTDPQDANYFFFQPYTDAGDTFLVQYLTEQGVWSGALNQSGMTGPTGSPVYYLGLNPAPGCYEQEIRISPVNNGIPQKDRTIHIAGSCILDLGIAFENGMPCPFLGNNVLNSDAKILDDDNWKISAHVIDTLICEPDFASAIKNAGGTAIDQGVIRIEKTPGDAYCTDNTYPITVEFVFNDSSLYDLNDPNVAYATSKDNSRDFNVEGTDVTYDTETGKGTAIIPAGAELRRCDHCGTG